MTTQPRAQTGSALAALLGSVLMFIGWVLAIVPAFHHIQRIALVLGVAVVGFGLVLIPLGLDLFLAPASPAKRGLGTLLISMLPAVILYLIVVTVLPVGTVARVLSLLTELGGMLVYGWAWWDRHRK